MILSRCYYLVSKEVQNYKLFLLFLYKIYFFFLKDSLSLTLKILFLSISKYKMSNLKRGRRPGGGGGTVGYFRKCSAKNDF